MTPMEKRLQALICRSKVHCYTCRTSVAFQQSLTDELGRERGAVQQCPFQVAVDAASARLPKPRARTRKKGTRTPKALAAPAAPDIVQDTRTAAEAEANLAICTQCEHYVKEADKCRKMQCGCSGRHRSRLKAVTCPLLKWS